MSTTLSTLRTLTRQQYRFDPNGRVFGDTELDGYIQKSYKHVQEQLWLLLDSKQAISTVSGTQEYLLPTTLFKIEDDWVKIDTICLYESSYSDTSGTTVQGKPTQYYLREQETGTNIGFIANPDSAYTINVFYKGYRPDLSSVQSTTINDKYDMLIALYAAYYAEYTLRWNTPNAVAKLQAYEQERKVVSKGRYKQSVTFRTQR
jgi:hypothetical protein